MHEILILILERTIELLVAADHVAQEKVEEARQLAISLTDEAAEQNEEIAEELLQVLYEKMWFRGPFMAEEGWAIEKICAALNAAQQVAAPDAACPCCGSQVPNQHLAMCEIGTMLTPPR